MKNHLLFTVFLASFAMLNAQPIVFADPAFKARLLASSTMGVAIGFDNNWVNIDANGDGEIEQSEALQVKMLLISGANIVSLDGIAHFSALQRLECESNNLTSLNLDGMSNLTEISCAHNQLTALSVNGCSNIASIDCNFNAFTTLDFLSNLPSLVVLRCSNNYLTQIDVTHVAGLAFLECNQNMLTSLDFSQNPQFNSLFCHDNDLHYINFQNGYMSTNLDMLWYDNPNLSNICADEGEIDLLNTISTLEEMQPIAITSTCSFLGRSHFADASISIFPNPAKNKVSIKANSNIKNISIFDLQGRILQTTSENSKETSVDLSGKANGVYLLKITTVKGSKAQKLVKE